MEPRIVPIKVVFTLELGILFFLNIESGLNISVFGNLRHYMTYYSPSGSRPFQPLSNQIGLNSDRQYIE